MTKQTLTNFLSRNFGAESGHTCTSSLYRAVRAPIGTRALRLQPHQPHGWSGPDYQFLLSNECCQYFQYICDKLDTCLPIMKRVTFFVHLPYTIRLSYFNTETRKLDRFPAVCTSNEVLDDLSRCVERLFMQFWYWSGKTYRIEVWLDTLRRFSLSVYMLSKGLK